MGAHRHLPSKCSSLVGRKRRLGVVSGGAGRKQHFVAVRQDIGNNNPMLGAMPHGPQGRRVLDLPIRGIRVHASSQGDPMTETQMQKYRRLIAQIHKGESRFDGDDVQLERAEFLAASNAFLGEDYDPDKLARVEELLLELRKEQDLLVARFETGQLSPKEYVDSLNLAIHTHMLACQDVLGREDYERLFRGPVPETVGVVDLVTFLQTVEEAPSGEEATGE